MIHVDRRQFSKNAGFLGLGIAASCGCKTAPVTGRPQLMLMPEGQEHSLGDQAFQETLASKPLSKDNRLSDLVNRVGNRIASVANRADYQWEFRLISAETQNAFSRQAGSR